MHFGESLAHLAANIAAGHGARKVSAGARAAGLSALHAATRQTLADNTAHRMVVASDLAAGAAALRKTLAEADIALGAKVRHTLEAARVDLAAKRDVIDANAAALRARLDASRRDGSAAVMAFRAATRSEQAASAAAMADSLGQFVAGVRSQTAQIQNSVQDQLLMARAAWGNTAAKAHPVQQNASVNPPPGQLAVATADPFLVASAVWGNADTGAHLHHGSDG